MPYTTTIGTPTPSLQGDATMLDVPLEVRTDGGALIRSGVVAVNTSTHTTEAAVRAQLAIVRDQWIQEYETAQSIGQAIAGATL